jgi:hypothetical protein
LAFEEFHDEEATAVFVLANFVDGANVGVIESGGSASFAEETIEGNFVARKIVGKKFESDQAAESGVFGFVDDAHTTAAELLNDAIVRKSLAENGVGFGHVAEEY